MTFKTSEFRNREYHKEVEFLKKKLYISIYDYESDLQT